jgi:hypothetical protein
MFDVYEDKIGYMKSIVEQAESNGLVEMNVLPDKVEITLKNKKIRIWFHSGEIERIEN